MRRWPRNQLGRPWRERQRLERRLDRRVWLRERVHVSEEALVSREELTAMLFAIADSRQDVREIRNWLKEEGDGQEPEDDS